MKKIGFILILISCVLLSSTLSHAQVNAKWLRRNAISPDGSTIAFNYKGDIFTVSVNGGKALQITSHQAYDTDPLWTPDGKQIIFASYREDSKDIFVVSAQGGECKRVTSLVGHETPMAVMKDGTILFSANLIQDADFGDFMNHPQIYAIGLEGGRPRQITSLPISNLSVNNSGYVLYEDYKGYEDEFRKHHTSSVTRDIWIYSPGENTEKFKISAEGNFKQLTDKNCEDRNPVFDPDGDTYYWLSELDGTFNIYKSRLSDPAYKEQLTFAKGNPVRYISIADNGTISYSYNGDLYVLPKGGESKKLDVEIVSDQYQSPLIERSFTGGASEIAVSPNGKEIAFIFRGDVFVTSVEYKTTKMLTSTPVRERNLSFSKDGRTLYYSSERDGHWGIYSNSLTDKEDKLFVYALQTEEKLFTNKGETCFQPMVSPDGKSLAFLKDRTSIVVKDIKSGKEKVVLDKNANYSYIDGDQSFTWSPDSNFILCNYQADGGWNNEDVALINIKTGEITDLTQSGYSDGNFRWALKGHAMTWTSDKDGYKSHGSWGAERDVYIMFFDAETYVNFTRTKEEKELLNKDEKKGDKKEAKSEKKDSAKTEKKVARLVLDLENRHDRVKKLSLFSGRLGDHYLTQDGKKLYYMTRLEKGMDLCMLDIEKKNIKVISKNVNGSFHPTADDKYLFLLSGGGITKITTASGAVQRLSFSSTCEMRPAQEREYMFEHIWKQVNEKFYDPQIHGIDWAGYGENYKQFLPHINNNFDFRDLLSEMLGELNGSHTGARYRYRSKLTSGSLGIFIDEEYEGNGLKIKEIMKGGAIYIQIPEAKAGDIILAIDGKEIEAGKDWRQLLKSKAGKKVVLTMKCGNKKEDFNIKPDYTDYNHLYKRWVNQRAEMVKKLSNGRIGYVHVTGMNSESFRRVYSELLGKYRTCEAVIVDTRHNGGGWLHDDLATLLDGKAYIRFEPRGQYIGTEPYSKWTKPSCVLIGEDNYSDASGFPYVYKTLGIGKLVGAPVPGTMTAVWWENQLDANIVFGIPQVGAVGIKEGRYLENLQVEPDIEVYNDPASLLKGEDKQIEAAVKHLLETIDNQ